MKRHPGLQPVLFQLLEPGDPGYDLGYRYRVEQVDGDASVFANYERALDFLADHGLQPVSEDDMIDIREELDAEY